MRVQVKPDLLRWAFFRAGLNEEEARDKFEHLDNWLSGKKQPTLKQLEDYAKRTHAALGFFFLEQPPEEEDLPLPDMRTVRDRGVRRPSVDLLDTIYLCQRRQEWYRDYAISNEQEPLPFVGSVTTKDDIETTAASMRHVLQLDIEERARFSSWEEARRKFVTRAEEIGVLVLTSGIVGLNTSRPLSTEEFRGFAIADDIAPLVFINGKDSQSAQMFTLAHELAHIWLGESAVSDLSPMMAPEGDGGVESWCNRVAAELLVPRAVIASAARRDAGAKAEAKRLAKIFKVSTLVLLRRLYDIGFITRQEMASAYESELAEIAARKERESERGSSGNFHTNLRAAVGTRLSRAIVAETLSGHTLHRDAMSLLGVSTTKAFDGFAQSLGFNP